MIRKSIIDFIRFSKDTSAKETIISSSRDVPVKRSVMREAVKAAGEIGLIAGNGPFPIHFIESVKSENCKVFAACHTGETDESIESVADACTWIKVGQLGSMIKFFKKHNLKYVAMAGGIDRINHFGDVKLDSRGAKLLLKLRSMKDDIIMRGIAAELLKEGVEVIDCTLFLEQSLVQKGVLAGKEPSSGEWNDIRVGIDAIKAMSDQDIGQLVVVRDGVIVAVEAVEGTDQAILRGGDLSGAGSVVVKFAKVTQDMRFDVPTVGMKTIETMNKAGTRVLALESMRSLIVEREDVFKFARESGITIVGCDPLVEDE